MRIHFQLEEEHARAVHRYLQSSRAEKPSSAETQKLLEIVRQRNGEIQAVHPGQSHPLLTPFFFVETRAAADAQLLLSDLKTFRSVSAVYLAPEAEAP